MSVPQNNPRIKMDTLGNRPSPAALPDGNLFAATDAPALAVSSSKQWRDLLQGGQAQLGVVNPGQSTIGPAPGLSLSPTSVIGLTRRLDVPPFLPKAYGMLVVTTVTFGGPNTASFEVSSMTAAGALVATDVGHFDWSVIG